MLILLSTDRLRKKVWGSTWLHIDGAEGKTVKMEHWIFVETLTHFDGSANLSPHQGGNFFVPTFLQLLLIF